MTAAIDILITGGTGYIGRQVIPVLVARGHRVGVLVRPASMDRVPSGATRIIGNALDPKSVEAAMRPGDTVIHLVGTPHPNPSKAAQFEKIDLTSIRYTVAAAKSVGISHLVYVSVAQPAPVMRSFIWVRTLGEAMIREAGLTATIVRPWYVLGPGHHWPVVLKPLYRLAEMIPAIRPMAERLGLITIGQMVNALVRAVENPPLAGRQRIFDVEKIKSARI